MAISRLQLAENSRRTVARCKHGVIRVLVGVAGCCHGRCAVRVLTATDWTRLTVGKAHAHASPAHTLEEAISVVPRSQKESVEITGDDLGALAVELRILSLTLVAVGSRAPPR